MTRRLTGWTPHILDSKPWRAALRRGFTVLELIIVVVIIAILAAITIVTYNGSQRRSADAQVRQTIADARKSLQVYYSFNQNYPPNIANTDMHHPSVLPSSCIPMHHSCRFIAI